MSKAVDLALKIIESVAWFVGPAVFTLNFFSFTVDRSGYFYRDGPEWGMAIGVLFISIAYITRLWRK